MHPCNLWLMLSCIDHVWISWVSTHSSVGWQSGKSLWCVPSERCCFCILSWVVWSCKVWLYVYSIFKSHYCKQHCEWVCKPGTDCQSRSNGDTDSKQHIPKIPNHIFLAMQMLLCTIIHTYEYHSCMHAQTTLMKLLWLIFSKEKD